MDPNTPLAWITPDFAALPQLVPGDVHRLAAQGVRLLINNRPDGEAPDQPSGAEIAAAAEAAGLAYAAIPVATLNPSAIADMRAALAGAPGPVAAFCRSGTRSAMLWACARATEGASPAALTAAAAEAGFDLSGLAPVLAALSAAADAPAGPAA
jgi:uncharacterized protein (TIGR01244 family)